MVATMEDFRSQMRGVVLTEGDPAYDEARKVHNGMHDRHPATIVHCADAGDVIAALRFARESGGDISVRGGGHSAPGFGTNDGGTVIDLTPMKGTRVDPRTRTARAEPGCTWGDFNHATYAFGLATTGGIVSTTGIAGLTLGGGIGYLARKAGLTIDNLLSADVVTADGEFLVANENENADLFWALRGGGGNFGIVTSFEYRLHSVKDILAGIFVYPFEQTRTVLEWFREFIKDAPEDLGVFPVPLIAPPLPFLPEAAVGKPHFAAVCCWTGSMEEGEKVMEAFRQVAPRVGEMVTPMPYPMLNSMFDELVQKGLHQYWKATFAEDLTDGAIEAHLKFGATIPTMNTAVHLYTINGAPHRVPMDATAFPYRNATYATVLAGLWPDPADTPKNVEWVRDYYNALLPHGEPGAYVNFMDADEGARVKDSYRGIYDRLVEVKRKYDRDNVFHMNQNIKP